MLITSLDNDRIKKYVGLKEKKNRDKTGQFIVEGMHLVLEAYKAGLIEELILEKDVVVPLNLPTVYVTNDILAKISTLETHPEIMALVNKKEEQDLGKRVLLLDNIQDPGNLGTIIRSACAFHIDTIILSDDTVDLYNPKVIRSTQGMIFSIDVWRKNLKEVIPTIKNKEIPLYGTNVRFGMDVTTLKEKDRSSFALIMGNEGTGVKEELMELCDANLYIPLKEDAESLNVAVACSILLYELDK